MAVGALGLSAMIIGSGSSSEQIETSLDSPATEKINDTENVITNSYNIRTGTEQDSNTLQTIDSRKIMNQTSIDSTDEIAPVAKNSAVN